MDHPTVHVLDHGYVKLIETWGSDERIIESARMSTNKGFLGWGNLCVAHEVPVDECEACTAEDAARRMAGEEALRTKAGDEKLLRFLWENKHATPFEMAGMTIEVQAPIFVYREWHRHRTQGYNELSARYTPMPDFNYIPTIERLLMGSDGKNKQAGTIAGAYALTEETAALFQRSLHRSYVAAEELYRTALEAGVPKELARVHLPVGRYSRMRATANLRNWLGFCTLRSDKNPGAQWEIRQYANIVVDLVATHFPRTHALFAEK